MPRREGPPFPKKKDENKEDIKLHDFSELGKHVAGVSDGIEEPSGGGSAPAEPLQETMPKGPAHARMQARERLAQMEKHQERERPAQAEKKQEPEVSKKRSKIEGTLHLKENPAPKAAESSFDSSEALKRANETLKGIRDDITASGVALKDVSNELGTAKDKHAKIVHAIREYKAAESDAERAHYEKIIKEQTSRLADSSEMKVRDAYQEKARSRPKAKGDPIAPSTSVLPNTFDRTLKNYMKGEAAAAATQAEIMQKRARLEELEAQERSGGHKSEEREAEFLKVEAELHKLEERLTGPRNVDELLTHNETAKKLVSLVHSETANYEGDPRHPVPAVGLRDDQKQVVKYKNTPLNFEEPEPEARELVLGDAEKLQYRLRELALETRGEEGAKLFESRGTDKETYLKQGATTLAMLEAEKDYLDSYGRHKKYQGMGATIASKFIDTDKFLPSHLKDKKEAWMKARGEYLASTNQSLESRIDARTAESGTPERKDKEGNRVIDRYERRYGSGVLAAALTGAEKAEQDTRIGALEDRSKEALEKLYDRYKNTPAYIRMPLTFAALTVVPAGVVAATGGAAIGLGGLLFAGTLVGGRAAAEHFATKNPAAKKFISMMNPAAWGNFLGAGGMRTLHSVTGADASAKKVLSQKQSMRNFADAGTADSVIARRNAANKKLETLDRQAALAGTVGAVATSVGVGALIGNFFRGMFGSQHAADAAHTAASGSRDAVHLATLKEYAETGKASTGVPEGLFGPQSLDSNAGITADGMDHMTVLGNPDAAAHHAGAIEHHAASATRHAVHHENAPVQVAEAPLTKEEINIIQKWEAEHPEANGLPANADKHVHEVLAMIQKDGSADTFKGVHFDSVRASVPAHELSASIDAPHAHETDLKTPPQESYAPEDSKLAHKAQELQEQLKHMPAREFGKPYEGDHARPFVSEATGAAVHINSLGLQIDTAHPHIYEDKQGLLIMHGGTPQQQLKMVEQYLTKAENYGRTVLVESPTPDPMTGAPNVIPFTSEQPGSYGPHTALVDERNIPILPPTENDFVKKLL
jgi:hypothetical protein